MAGAGAAEAGGEVEAGGEAGGDAWASVSCFAAVSGACGRLTCGTFAVSEDAPAAANTVSDDAPAANDSSAASVHAPAVGGVAPLGELDFVPTPPARGVWLLLGRDPAAASRPGSDAGPRGEGPSETESGVRGVCKDGRPDDPGLCGRAPGELLCCTSSDQSPLSSEGRMPWVVMSCAMAVLRWDSLPSSGLGDTESAAVLQRPRSAVSTGAWHLLAAVHRQRPCDLARLVTGARLVAGARRRCAGVLQFVPVLHFRSLHHIRDAPGRAECVQQPLCLGLALAVCLKD